MSVKNAIGSGGAAKTAAAVALLLSLGCANAAADGFRNITAVSIDCYFDGAYRLSIEDVFLARLVPGFSVQVKVARFDRMDFYEHVFSAGAVVNFTEAWYLDALYGVGVDSDFQIEHRAEVNLNYEKDEIVFGAGVRMAYFASAAYGYLIPSASVKIRLVAWLAMFNKIFASFDNLGVFSGSYWGELQWITGEAVTIRAGGTVSWSGAFGYSLLAGIDLRFSPTVLLKYHFQFLGDSIDYGSAPLPVFGVQNALFLDIMF